MQSEISRRTLLQASGAMAASALGLAATSAQAAENNSAGSRPIKGNINQSVVHWCFKKYWDIEKTAQVASQLGMKSVELTPAENWKTLKKHGLTCAIASSHGFKVGFNNPDNWDQCIEILRKRIDECAAGGVNNVITFTGMRDGISDDEGARNCVAGLKKIIGYAEKNKVNLCLEMLNSRDSSHPMKGHPGYQGDHTEYCIDIIKQVGSERMKLLFDIYHVQIMDGDVIRRLHEHKDYIGHVHTAGNPGRGELDMKQEINYPPIMQALLDIGYQGFVGQEFIPTRDPYQGLQEAVVLCDV
ncbi:hydroxypyruvate isomerase family protein [Gimesia panareensis]|uniref:Hydroxypyruvate isomerase n=1 Tax=Gimesia panareensis TaxID=2527978 RepID=A0A518FIF9_9PLAN|nr:TIM barrel protein [Gimesia panareensis]QDU50592.1 Hydroxypyruvate isomerase [Gimesia panareensis]QDV16138.1 Hydroxypyruvate isomerase [Gimesia panareensis]